MKAKERSTVILKKWLIAFAVVFVFVVFLHIFPHACSGLVENVFMRDTVITCISDSMKNGIEEKYGYIIPDNAEFIFGKVRHGRESTMELYFSVELEGLPGYKKGMEPSGIYRLMWNGKTSDADYGSYFSEVDKDFEAEHGVKFDLYAQCEIAPFSGIWLSKIKDGKIFVYIDGYRPASSWYD